MTVSILAFAGSSRAGSLNQRLLAAAMGEVESLGAEVTHIDLRQLNMPLYDGDVEANDGLPEGAKRLQEALREHDGLLIASPEYNSGYTPLLKNAIDWVSRPRDGWTRLAAFQDQTAALIGASPGSLGALRSLMSLRAVLQNIGVHVVPTVASYPQMNADQFTENGTLREHEDRQRLRQVMGQLVDTVRARRELQMQ